MPGSTAGHDACRYNAMSKTAPRNRSGKANGKRSLAKAGAGPAVTGSSEADLLIDGQQLHVSRLDKVFYPKTGFTKGQVLDYYIRIAPVLLPHLKDRLLTLKRYPNGVDGGFFYEKRCPPYRPTWIKTASMWSEQHDSEIHFCVANNLASLVWAANLADLELHTYLSKAPDVDRPTLMVFDLDPGPPADIMQCAHVAILLKNALDQFGLEGFPKTSGSKGLQVYVPLNTKVAFAQTKTLARALAEALAQQHPDLIVAKMNKSYRSGKVLIDWSQNDRHKTTVCVYSLRAKEEPLVSTPLTWDELRRALKEGSASRITFLPDQVLKRVSEQGDLFQPVLELRQKIPLDAVSSAGLAAESKTP
jgi:bifunctional non-homologous end joining protein LigD